MPWKTLALALGITLAADATDADAKAAVTAKLKIDATADDATIAAAISAQLQGSVATPAAASATADPVAVLAALPVRNRNIRASFQPFRSRSDIGAEVVALEADILADHNVTEAQASARLMEILGRGAESAGGSVRITAGQDQRDKTIKAKTEAVLARVNKAKADGANPYRGRRLIDLASASLVEAGIGVLDMSFDDIAEASLGMRVRGAQTTSDFPVVLQNVLHLLVLESFNAAPQTWQQFCRQGDVTDFRPWQRLIPGAIGNLDVVNEGAEYKNKNLPDATGNSISVKRRGNIIEITPEVLVNDDLGYIQSLASDLGIAGPRSIERAVYALLNSNPTMADGNALFSTAHGNLAGSGAAPTALLIDTGRNAMAIQTLPGDDAEYADISPSISVCNTTLASTFNTIIASPYNPDATSKYAPINPVQNLLPTRVSSPRVTGNAWYLFANPDQAPVIEVVFLNGQRAPVVKQLENFRTEGLAWRVSFPFGAGVIDYRGAYKNPGA